MPDCPEDTDDHARDKGAIAFMQVREREPPPGYFLHRDSRNDVGGKGKQPAPPIGRELNAWARPPS